MNLQDKVAIVTGGSNGIGREIVRTLASLGAKVIINYNFSETKAIELQSDLAKQNFEVEVFKADVASFKESEELINFAIDKYGRLDILVNNAGITSDNLIMRMGEEDFDRVININLKGTWNCSKHATKYMAKQRFGKIINISSVVGIMGNAGQTNYAASKAGIIGLTKSLARELAKRNINVNAVAPGFIQTNMTASLNEALVQGIIENIPLGRLGEAKDVANLVAFLASEKAAYITGQVINVNGGLMMN